jgi:poly-gamma-glutamate synthesis protein (capsule biosynthesis protein)
MGGGGTIRLAAVGDIALNAGYEDLLLQGRGQEAFAEIAPLFVGTDLVIGNLEGPLTERPNPSPPWRHCLRGHPAYAPILRAAGFHVLSLANNHMMDYGWPGVEETIERLTAVGIRVVGAGKNLEDARRPIKFAVNGVRVAILAYCSIAVRNPLYASAHEPGVAPARASYIMEDVLKARKEADFVVVCLHWGQEIVGYPAPRFRRLARNTISAGAGLIIGHHPHVLQGLERFRQGLVAYSLGNFTFADEVWNGADRNGNSFTMLMRISEASRRTAVLKAEVVQEGRVVNHELLSAYLRADLRVAPDPRPERFVELKRSCRLLGNPGYALIWSGLMLKSRARVVKEQLFGNRGFWRRLSRLRPRHMREALRILGREWEQFRGAK